MKVVAFVMASLLAVLPSATMSQTISDAELIALGKKYHSISPQKPECYSELLDKPYTATITPSDQETGYGLLGVALILIQQELIKVEAIANDAKTISDLYNAGKITQEQALTALNYLSGELDKSEAVVLTIVNTFPSCSF